MLLDLQANVAKGGRLDGEAARCLHGAADDVSDSRRVFGDLIVGEIKEIPSGATSFALPSLLGWERLVFRRQAVSTRQTNREQYPGVCAKWCG